MVMTCRIIRMCTRSMVLERFRGVFARSTQPWHPGDHRTRPESHLRSTPVVSTRPSSRTGQSLAQFLCVERVTEKSTRMRALSLRTLSRPTGRGTRWPKHYSASLLLHQPDLNYDSPRVRKAILEVVDFWFDLGVDGLRLDAVPYLYERDGTNCENLLRRTPF